MKKLTKKQIEKFAQMHIAIHASVFDYFGLDESCGICEEDVQKCVQAVEDKAIKIANGLPMNFGDNKSILEYVRKHF